jgi:hypothetical protein
MSGSSWGRAAVGGGRPIAKPFDGRQEIDVNVIANGLIGLVTQNHVGFLVREMFWDHPVGRRIFGMTRAVRQATCRSYSLDDIPSAS